MNINEHTPTECPGCYAMLDASTIMGNTEAPRPRPLDFSVCIHCGIALRFEEDMSIRMATEDDLEELRPDQSEMMANAKRIIQSLHGSQRP